MFKLNYKFDKNADYCLYYAVKKVYKIGSKTCSRPLNTAVLKYLWPLL